ncbi:MAG: hypothetical protein IKO00_03585 [Oscillospiraceae bacterium]|nr:hypothetical protein [Oscillospiraceae bacterium]
MKKASSISSMFDPVDHETSDSTIMSEYYPGYPHTFTHGEKIWNTVSICLGAVSVIGSTLIIIFGS